MEKYLVNSFIFITDRYLWYKIISNMCSFRYHKKYKILQPIPWIFIFIMIGQANNYLKSEGLGLSILFSMLTLIMGFILTFIFYKDKIMKLLLWNVVYLLLMAVSELSTLLFLWIGTGKPVELILNEGSAYYIGAVISKLIMFVLILLITMKRDKYNIILEKGLTEIICLGTIILTMLIYFIYLIGASDIYATTGKWFYSTTLASLFLIVMLVVRIMFQLFKMAKQELEAQHKVYRLETELQLYDDMDKVISTLRSLRHDLNNHFGIINGLLLKEKYQECHEYMKEVYSELDMANSFVFVENTALSVLLNNKISKAKKKGIEIENIISLDNFSIPYKTICSLIGNILDNAIEATEKTEDKYIQLVVKGKDGECKISCCNTYGEKPIFIDGKFQSTKNDKKNHGIGLMKVKEVVEEYHGTMKIEVDDMFRITLTLKA